MTVYISLGANLGTREQTIEKAVALLKTTGCVEAQSDLFYSEPWGFESEHGFCNICLRLNTELTPLELLHQTQAIERQLGRTEKSKDRIYHDRVIDIDLIRAFDQKGDEIHVSSPELTLPHPLWKQREFVTVPLAQICQNR